MGRASCGSEIATGTCVFAAAAGCECEVVGAVWVVVRGAVIKTVVVNGTETVTGVVTVMLCVMVVGTKLVMFLVKKTSVVKVEKTVWL